MPIQVRVVIELALYTAAVAAVVAAGQPVLAVILAVAALATSLLNARQERQVTRSGVGRQRR